MDILERPAVQPAGPAWDLELARWRQPATLLQSWAWGEVQGRLGWEVARVLAPAPVTLLVRRHRAVRWGYVPRGPVDWTPGALQRLASWARDQGLARLRVEPEAGPEVRQVLALLGFRRTRQVQPAHTLIVPLGDEATMPAPAPAGAGLPSPRAPGPRCPHTPHRRQPGGPCACSPTGLPDDSVGHTRTGKLDLFVAAVRA